jgi:hypothetical protein
VANTSYTGPDVEAENGEDILMGDNGSEFGYDDGHDGLVDYEPEPSSDRYLLRFILLT